MPLSPYFANLMLHDFDQEVISAKLAMVRYADDLVFFAPDQASCEKIHKFCVDRLLKIGLTVHALGTPGKSIICSPNEPVEFLGVELVKTQMGYRLEISPAQIERRKTELVKQRSIRSLVEQRITISKFLKTLDAKIQGWSDAYKHCDNVSQLTDMLKDCRVNVINNVMTCELGIMSPTTTQRQFLELDPLPPRRLAQQF
jgi:RNA-directed DNA polymerase